MKDVRPLLNRWSDAGQRWTDSTLKEIVARAPRAPSSRWPLFGMFAAGLLLGAVGVYAVTRRTHLARLAGDIFIGEEVEVDDVEPASFTSHRPNRTNHRRKAGVEVS